MSTGKETFELAHPRLATELLTCEACGRRVTRRGYAAHLGSRACDAAVVEQEMARRGWVRAKACATKLRRSGCPLERRMGKVGTSFRHVWWTPAWAIEAYREGEPARDMMVRLAADHEEVAAELAVLRLSGGKR